MKQPRLTVAFSQPLTRRSYIWLLLLAPFVAAWLYLSPRSRFFPPSRETN